MHATRKAPAPRQSRPAQRYFPGKAPKGVEAVDSDSDSEAGEELEQQHSDVGDVAIGGDVEQDHDDDVNEEDEEHAVLKAKPSLGKAMNVSLKNVNISNGKVIVDGRAESGRTNMEESEETPPRPPGFPTSQADGSSSEYETDSEEEEEEEIKPAAIFRPVFVPKRGRVTIQEIEAEAQNTPEALAKREAEAAQRKRESHDLVAESIKRELAEKEVQELIPDVDDTDGLDPAAEFEEWRLRELGRVKRDKEAQVRREEEREEIERRRALPEAQRLAEDLAHAQKSRDGKPHGQQKFLQKYYHKGAYHQDLEILKKRDYTEATQSTVDMSLLPQVMQVKDFGKRSRTKYTHLLDQDTTRNTGGFGGVDLKGKGAGPGLKDAQGCFNCGGPHLKRDCPNVDPNGAPMSGGSSSGRGTGANNGFAAVKPTRQWGVRKDPPTGPPHDRDAPRHWKDRGVDEGYRQRQEAAPEGRDDLSRQDGHGHGGKSGGRDQSPRHGERDRYRDRDRPRRSRSRSRSPNRYRRRRSRSRSIERSDKRRRRD